MYNYVSHNNYADDVLKFDAIHVLSYFSVFLIVLYLGLYWTSDKVNNNEHLWTPIYDKIIHD